MNVPAKLATAAARARLLRSAEKQNEQVML